MITERYPSKRKPTVSSITSTYGGTPLTVEQRAAARGITVEEFRERVIIVAKTAGSCLLYKNQKVVPIDPKIRAEHGICTVVNVCRSYDMYGEVEWHNPPFIVMIQSGLKHGQVINCTPGYVEPYREAQTNVC